MSNKRQHKYTRCHFSPMVMYTVMNHNANAYELWVISSHFKMHKSLNNNNTELN